MNLFKKSELPKPEDFMPKKPEEIDSSKRYDIYTNAAEGKLIVYRNVKFLGTRSLPGENQYAPGASLLLLQQDDGTEFLISAYSYFCVCQHGKKPVIDIRPMNDLQ